MEGTNLQILITAVDNASAALSQVSSELGSVATSAQSSTDSASQSFSDLLESVRSTALQIGAAAGVAFAGLSAEIASASSTNEKMNMSLTDIQTTLKNTGSSLPISDIQNFAKSLEGVTLNSQQQIVQAAGLVVGNKELQGSYQTVVTTAADLAQHLADLTGQTPDLTAATRALVAIMNDPTTAATRLARTYNIDLDAAQKKIITNMAKTGDVAGAQALLLKAVEDQIGGVAQAADNASGSGLTKLQNSMEDLQNTIGGGLNPTLDDMWKKIGDIVEKLTDWIDAHPKLTAAILLVAAAIAGMVTVIAALVVGITTVGIAMLALGAGPIAGIVLIIVGLIALIGSIIAWHTQMVAAMQAAWQLAKDIVSGVVTDLESVWDGFKSYIKTLLGDVGTYFQNLYNTYIQPLLNAIQTVSGFIGKGVGAVGNAIGSVGNFIGSTIKAFADGGIVNGPTLALVGEAGPEMIIPLSAVNGGPGLGSAGQFGNGGNIVINMTGNFPTDANAARAISNLIATQIQTQLRLKRIA